MVSFAVGLGWCVKNCIKLRRAGRKLLHSVDSDGRHHYGHASDLWVHCEREYDTIVCLGVCLTVLLFRSYLRSGWSQNKLLRTVGMWLYGQMPFVLSRHGPWKSLNLCLKVLESAWIWFSKTPWPNQLILKKVFQMASFWPQMCIKSIFWLGLCPGPHWGSLQRLYMLIKVPVWFNLVLLIQGGPKKSEPQMLYT